MGKDFTDLLESIHTRADSATTIGELTDLDSDVELAAAALVMRTALLEKKLVRHQGAVALGYRRVNEATLDQQALESVEQ